VACFFVVDFAKMYLLGINLPDEKRVDIALTSIYGIGRKTGEKICHQLEIHPQCRLKELTEAKITKLSQLLNTMDIEAELKRKVHNNISNLVTIGSWRGSRHQQGKPVRGQRTRSNASTAKKLNGASLRAASTRSFSTLARSFCRIAF
jgi:small subunit ribosomal protein S13